MSIRPGQKYHGSVGAGSKIIQSQNGTMGYQLMLECEDGYTDYTIWLTEKNKDRARAAFADVLGVPEGKLRDHNYFELRLGDEICGRPITFTTVEEEYKGKRRTKVAFIFKPGAWAGNKSPGQAAAEFFGAETLTDDDLDSIPF